MRHQPEQAIDGHMKQQVYDQSKNVRQSELKIPAAYARHQTVERGKQRRTDRVDKIPEAIAAPRSQQIENYLQRDQAVGQIEEVIDNL